MERLEKTDKEPTNGREFRRFLRNFVLIGNAHVLLFCGSSVELPLQYMIANATDVDIMFITTDICALPVNNVSASRTVHSKTLVISTEDTHPGFARLRSPDCKRFYRRQMGLTNFQNNSQNGPAWTSELFNVKRTDFGNSKSGNIDGNCSQFREMYERLMEMKVDRVFAVHCPCWPPEAGEWKTRDRPNGWPPAEVVEKVVASGCYFVAKSHHSSPNDDTQWRFSFSQAEIILIHRWTDVQKYIYHVLRLIKSRVVKACGGSDETVICTYFFKTLMLWECERRAKDFWEDENMEKSISELLCVMIGWLIDKSIPSYFIPKYNMINASTEGVDFTKEIRLLFDYALSNMRTITAMWPEIYQRHMICPFQIVLSEKTLLYYNLMQVRSNYLNPLSTNKLSHLVKQLTETNSLLWREASDLYSGILSHLQFMKTHCPIRRYVLHRIAMDHLDSSLTKNGEQCAKMLVSIGESFYELLQRIGNATEFECDLTMPVMHTDFCEMQLSSNCRQSPLNSPTPAECTCRPTTCCHDHHLESALDHKEKKFTDNATIVTEHINAAVKIMLQNLCVKVVDHITISAHVLSSAYLANFYYTALQDYEKASALCDTVLDHSSKLSIPKDRSLYDRAFPIFITHELATIFDKHFQTVLGLLALHRFIVDSSSQDNSAVLVRIRPSHFLMYLEVQCKRLKGMDQPRTDFNFQHRNAFSESCTYEPFSAVFMSAVLHASCCQ